MAPGPMWRTTPGRGSRAWSPWRCSPPAKRPDSKNIKDALEYLRGFGPGDLHSTYAISLQTMVFATADPAKDELRIRANVVWLEEAQIKPGDPQSYPGSWSYSESKRGRSGDNSNTQYALLGLHAASEVGIPVKPTVWELRAATGSAVRNATGAGLTPSSRLTPRRA